MMQKLAVPLFLMAISGCVETSSPSASETPEISATPELCVPYAFHHQETLVATPRSSLLLGPKWLQLEVTLPSNQSDMVLALEWSSFLREDLDVTISDKPIIGNDPKAGNGTRYENAEGLFGSPDSPAKIATGAVSWRHWWVFVETDPTNVAEARIPIEVSVRGGC